MNSEGKHHHLLHPQGVDLLLLLPLLIAQALLPRLPEEGGLLPPHLPELPLLHLHLHLLPGRVLLFLRPLQTGCTPLHHQRCPRRHHRAHHHLHLCLWQGPQHHRLPHHLRLHQGHHLPLACLLMVTIKFQLLQETKQLFWIKLERVLS